MDSNQGFAVRLNNLLDSDKGLSREAAGEKQQTQLSIHINSPCSVSHSTTSAVLNSLAKIMTCQTV